MVELSRRGSLSDQIASAITRRIHDGVYKRGEQLPTEQVLIEEFRVSRTVVREAIANLKAGGLVNVRQGVGVFVQRDIPHKPFFIEEASLGVVNDTVAVLELRIALETEAAALAAARHDQGHLDRMQEAMATMATAIEADTDSIASDLAFHRTVAEATGNPHFLALFNHLGELVIPRTRLKTFQIAGSSRQAYLDRVNAEHGEVYRAIATGDSDSARAAMRLHLIGSKARLQSGAEVEPT